MCFRMHTGEERLFMKRAAQSSTFIVRTLVALALCAAASPIARADIFVLTNDGQIHGEMVNTDDAPRQQFVIRTPEGATVTIDRGQVKQIIPQTPAQMEFDKVRPTYADTLEQQWKLAEWCRENSLTRERQSVLEHIIELSPDYKPARLALGYSMVDGRWMQEDQIMQSKGYVRYRNKWRLPQEIEVLENREKDDAAVRQWFANLKKWRAWLDDTRADQARDAITSIDDPFALPALLQSLNAEHDRNVSLLYIKALARIGTPDAVKGLATRSLDDADDEIRAECLDQLVGKPQPDAVAVYVEALKSADNARVNRAGYALGRMGDKSAVGPLIDALVTAHKFKEVDGNSNPNGISAGMTNQGGGAFSTGSSTRIITRNLTNQRVLDSLVALTGVNLDFDQKAWKRWLATQSKDSNIDVRRD